MRVRDEAVVVIHGLWLPGSETWLLRRRLAAHGYRPYSFRYRTVADDLERNAGLLARFLAGVPEPTTHLIGYSLGGVVAVHTLRRIDTARIGRLVCLGSPLNGSLSAEALLKLPGGQLLLGQSMLDLVREGGVGPWLEKVELGVIAGDLAFGLGRCLGAHDGPNDGTVAVVETRIDGAAGHIVRHVSHTSMLFSAEVADDAARFLEKGRF